MLWSWKSLWVAVLIGVSRDSFQFASNSAAPVVVSANCFDGQTIGVCFSKTVDPVSATNLANYTIADSNVVVSEATLRPDQSSVILRLSKLVPDTALILYVKNLRDLEGNSTPTGYITRVNNLSAAEIGTPAVDPKEPSSVFNCSASFEVTSGGSGLQGTNDGFYFIYEPWAASYLTVEGQVASLEPANRLSSAGLMVREDLSPGSRYFSLTLTPPNVPARDGSGDGANRLQVKYRDAANGPVTELSVTNMIFGVPYTNISLYIFRNEQRFAASFTTNRMEWVPVAEVTFSAPIPDNILVGMATSSQNNNVGFATRAVYSSYSILRSDPPIRPRLLAERAAGDLVLSWIESADSRFFVVSASQLGSWTFWEPITNPVVVSSGRTTVTVPLAGPAQFYALKLSRF